MIAFGVTDIDIIEGHIEMKCNVCSPCDDMKQKYFEYIEIHRKIYFIAI